MRELFKANLTVPETTLVRKLPDGESVILSVASERYFTLDRMGTAMWEAMTSASSIEEAFHRLASEYDVTEDRLRADLQDLVEHLADQGLVNLVP